MDSGGAERVVSIILSKLNQKYNITLVLIDNFIFYDIPKNIKIMYLNKSTATKNGLIKFFLLFFRSKTESFVASALKVGIFLPVGRTLVRSTGFQAQQKVIRESD